MGNEIVRENGYFHRSNGVFRKEVEFCEEWNKTTFFRANVNYSYT
jgi:hypothetical protein